MFKLNSKVYVGIPVPFAKLRSKMKSYFKRPLIVVSKTFPPAILKEDFNHKGKNYARVMLTNKQNADGKYPLTDIPSHLIEKVYKGNSPFMRDLIKYKLLSKTWMTDDNY